MLEWLLDNFWLSLYIGLSQAFILNYAAKHKDKHPLGLFGVIFVLIFAPFWPLILVIMLFVKR